LLEEVGYSGQRSAQPPRDIPNLFYRLKKTRWDERKTTLRSHLEQELRRILALDPEQPLDRHRGFFDMGMDSLTSIELKKRLETSLGCLLPSSLTFTYPNIAALVDYLAVDVLHLDSSEPQQGMDELSDEEVEASLLKELDNAGY
jgi:acyl carrier protein